MMVPFQTSPVSSTMLRLIAFLRLVNSGPTIHRGQVFRAEENDEMPLIVIESATDSPSLRAAQH